MYNEGEIVRVGDLVDPTSGRLSWILKKVRLLMSRPSNAEEALQENVVLSALLRVCLPLEFSTVHICI